MTKKKHDWNSLEDYLRVHERVMKTYARNMVSPKSYIHYWITEYWLNLSVENMILQTYSGSTVRVDIRKDIEVDRFNKKRFLARTIDYTYSANRPRGELLIRYCSPHSDAKRSAPDHHKFHHKHVFVDGKQKIIRIGDDDWPHVDEFLREVLESF
jgi:hypothetical protein